MAGARHKGHFLNNKGSRLFTRHEAYGRITLQNPLVCGENVAKSEDCSKVWENIRLQVEIRII